MGVAEDLADKLAIDAIAAAETLGDERLIEQVATALGTSSPTTEEAFRTAVRVRLAEQRARKLLDKKIADARVAPAAPGEE